MIYFLQKYMVYAWISQLVPPRTHIFVNSSMIVDLSKFRQTPGFYKFWRDCFAEVNSKGPYVPDLPAWVWLVHTQLAWITFLPIIYNSLHLWVLIDPIYVKFYWWAKQYVKNLFSLKPLQLLQFICLFILTSIWLLHSQLWAIIVQITSLTRC